MRRAVLALCVMGLVASACSLGPREEWVELIRGGLDVAEVSGTAKVRQTVSYEAIETNVRELAPPLIAEASGVAIFDDKLAHLREDAKRKAQVIYDDLVVYLSRSKSSIGKSGKTWARLDYVAEPSDDIDANDRRLSVGAPLISPVLAVEMLEGVLTGSIEEEGAEEKGGVATTRYTARLAPDAAVIEIRDEDRKEGVERMLSNLGIQQDDFPVEVWVDDESRIRGIHFEMRQQKDRVNAFALDISWEFTDYGTKADVELPPADETIRSGRYRDFVEELLREF